MSARVEQIDRDLKDLERQVQIIQFQVLNNIDAILLPEGKPREAPVDPKELDALVKRPLMLALTRIKSVRISLVRLINTEE